MKEQPFCHTYSINPRLVSMNDLLSCISELFEVTDITIKKPEIDEIVRKIYTSQSGEKSGQ